MGHHNQVLCEESPLPNMSPKFHVLSVLMMVSSLIDSGLMDASCPPVDGHGIFKYAWLRDTPQQCRELCQSHAAVPDYACFAWTYEGDRKCFTFGFRHTSDFTHGHKFVSGGFCNGLGSTAIAAYNTVDEMS